MKAALRLLVIAMLVVACIGSESLGADFRGPVDDGWHTWQVAAAGGGKLQIYASIEHGKPVRLRVRGDSVCTDNFDVEALDLGFIDVGESIDWLQAYIEPRSILSSDAIMAISLHAGDRSVTVLTNILTQGKDRENREEALFWLAQSESDTAFDVLDRLLSGNN